MTPKLIISSLIGIATIGGGVTGCYYAFGSSNTKELENKDTKVEETNQKPADAGAPDSQGAKQVQPSLPDNRASTSVSTTTPNTVNRDGSTIQPADSGVQAPRQ